MNGVVNELRATGNKIRQEGKSAASKYNLELNSQNQLISRALTFAVLVSEAQIYGSKAAELIKAEYGEGEKPTKVAKEGFAQLATRASKLSEVSVSSDIDIASKEPGCVKTPAISYLRPIRSSFRAL